MGASILPVTFYNGRIFFLFGKERDIDENPGWSDFGGGTEKGETFLETAIREGGEELKGFLGSDEEIRNMLKKYGTFNIDYKSNGYSTYRCHIFPMEYDEKLPYYYNNNQRFLQKRLYPDVIKKTKIFEKEEIRWLSIDEMKSMKSQFRFFFPPIIDRISNEKVAIKKFISKGLGIANFKKRTTQKNRSRALKF
jgi:8-oxo-dGTP pyrophosphatase MutT (NUDIX family)